MGGSRTRWTVPTAAEMEELGRRLGQRLWPGAVVALIGPLGAGKTTLTRGIARGLGCREDVRSPTFTLIHTYPGRIPLHHIDAYRIENLAQWQELGPEEFLEGEGVTVVEWAERVNEGLPEERLEVEIAGVGLKTPREVYLRPRGSRFERLVEELVAAGGGRIAADGGGAASGEGAAPGGGAAGGEGRPASGEAAVKVQWGHGEGARRTENAKQGDGERDG